MAEVNKAFDYDRPDRDAHERAGIGLLSRFIGAVFLVLLGGLLLLDRSLLKANRSQTVLDAEASSLLIEAYVGSQVILLGHIRDVVGQPTVWASRVAAHNELFRLVKDTKGLRYAWIADSPGNPGVSVLVDNRDSIPSIIRNPLQGDKTPGVTIGVVRGMDGRMLIAIVQRHAPGATSIFAEGLVLDGTGVEALLDRMQPAARVTVAVTSGRDTVVSLGHRTSNLQALAVEQKVVRLPNGGTWTVSATHVLTTQSLRWAIWALGTTGVLFLALGLLREQRRVIDASERSAELERLYRDVKRANQAKSEFLANVSHELRTPLNAIVGFVELLREGFYGDLSPRQVLPVDRIAASATHLRHLVDQVLDIAKIAAGRLEVHSETIVLRPFVLNTASELESLVSEKGLSFSITVSASLPRVRTDPTHLRQILINLIGNAVKYTPAGTISVRARLIGAPVQPGARRSSGGDAVGAALRILTSRAPRSGTWIALQVVDSGVGIAAADLERIFDEFEQVNAGPRGDSMQRGTGLGLAISRRLARLLGGEIGVESNPGLGSTFTIWLPVNPADLTRDQIVQTPADVPVVSA